MKPLSEVAPGLLVIQIQIQAVCVRNLWISLELCQDLRDQSTICSRYFLHIYSPQLSIESGRHNNSLALIGRSSIHLCLKYSSYSVIQHLLKLVPFIHAVNQPISTNVEQLSEFLIFHYERIMYEI